MQQSFSADLERASPEPINFSSLRERWATSTITINPDESLVVATPSDRLRVLPHYASLGISGAQTEIKLRSSVLDLLALASKRLPGLFAIGLLDGWRSAELQNGIYAHFRELVANSGEDPAKYAFDLGNQGGRDYPTEDAPHRTGGAVDVVLIDPAGYPWSMGSEFDEPSSRSNTSAFEGTTDSPLAKLGRRALFHAMTSVGFTNYPEEWWHYDYGNAFWRHYAGLPQNIPVFKTVKS